MNEENLRKGKATQFKAGEEQARISQKGWEASVKVRAERKAVRQAILDALYAVAPSGMTVLEEMISGMIKRVVENGDQNTFEKIMEYANLSPDRKRKDEEEKLKKKEAERKNPSADSGPSIFEQMVRELYERPD